MSTRALVVADDPLARRGLVDRLQERLIISACPPSDAKHRTMSFGASVVIWDLGAGATDVRAFEATNLSASAIALSSQPEVTAALLAAGANAVLERSVSTSMLISALVGVQAGLRVVEPSLLVLPASDAARIPRPPAGARELTPRELEVLGHLAGGLSNKRIGVALGISSHTAKFHIGAILTKLDATTRTQAVVRAVQWGLVNI